MKRKLIFTMMLAVLAIGAAHAKKYKVAVSLPQAQHTQFERTAQWALQTIAANEPSKADMLDPDMQIWLSNGFTRAFEQVLWRDPNAKLRDLYQYVAPPHHRQPRQHLQRGPLQQVQGAFRVAEDSGSSSGDGDE